MRGRESWMDGKYAGMCVFASGQGEFAAADAWYPAATSEFSGDRGRLWRGSASRKYDRPVPHEAAKYVICTTGCTRTPLRVCGSQLNVWPYSGILYFLCCCRCLVEWQACSIESQLETNLPCALRFRVPKSKHLHQSRCATTDSVCLPSGPNEASVLQTQAADDLHLPLSCGQSHAGVAIGSELGEG